MVSGEAGREWHPVKRARERFGVILTKDDLRQVVAQIQAGETILLVSRPNHPAESHLIEVQGCLMQAVFDRKAQAILTFLHPSMRTKTRRKKRR